MITMTVLLGLGLWCLTPQYFSYIVAVSFIGGETGVHGENHRRYQCSCFDEKKCIFVYIRSFVNPYLESVYI